MNSWNQKKKKKRNFNARNLKMKISKEKYEHLIQNVEGKGEV